MVPTLKASAPHLLSLVYLVAFQRLGMILGVRIIEQGKKKRFPALIKRPNCLYQQLVPCKPVSLMLPTCFAVVVYKTHE